MDLVDGRLYTPDEVSTNGWLGPDTTPGAIRKAASRGQIEHTKFQGRIYLTRANILAIQATGLEPANKDRPALPASSRRGRRAPAAVTELHPDVKPLVARPEARRRKAS